MYHFFLETFGGKLQEGRKFLFVFFTLDKNVVSNAVMKLPDQVLACLNY